MKDHESIKDLISNIKNHEEVDITWVLDKNSDEAIVAFALRFLASNLDKVYNEQLHEEVSENLYDCLS